MKKITTIIFIWIVTAGGLLAGEKISARLYSQVNGETLPMVNIMLEGSTIGTMTNEEGVFSLNVDHYPAKLIFSHIGFERKVLKFTFQDEFEKIYLMPTVLKTDKIMVSATRAVKGKTPVAFSVLSAKKIAIRNSIEDVPMTIASTPGVYAYSESGNGTGYSYLTIRGFDQSRVAVMLDNVPLNDNESHQVYWVDHADILSDAESVQIQRGVGNSLYGAAAFGGSINVETKIHSENSELALESGMGSYNTKKNKIAWKSGALFGDNISVRTRYTNQLSDGYRDFHDSEQNSFYLGIEQRGSKITNQFRVLLGKEITNQTWDGVYQNYIDDRDLRRVGVEAYTDNFYQKIISLNSKYRLNSHSFLSNTAYVVQGEGFYEVFKIDQDFYSYNLDEGDISKYQNESDFLRRKWIVNQYSGLIPQYSYQTETLRLDMGAEIRSYAGDHFGEISQFSDTLLADKYADNWVRYYRYKGKKHSTSAFARLSYTVTNDLSLMFDLQLQQQDWTLDQEPIGHATGYELATVWRFINPRLGAMYNFTSDVSIYVNYSQADKEPADNQIIEADDVWSEPVYAAAESIDDYELGFYYKSKFAQINLNMYRIHFFNEQLKTIDVNQEGEYDSFSADETIHQGIEFEVNFQTFNKVYFDINAAYQNNYFLKGIYEGNALKTNPEILLNSEISYQVLSNLTTSFLLKYVGKQYLDNENIGSIDSYFLTDLSVKYSTNYFTVKAKINNIFDTLYSTFGYAYEWDGYHAYYWPGATRNAYISLEVKI